MSLPCAFFPSPERLYRCGKLYFLTRQSFTLLVMGLDWRAAARLLTREALEPNGMGRAVVPHKKGPALGQLYRMLQLMSAWASTARA